jgi:hypothetical protein
VKLCSTARHVGNFRMIRRDKAVILLDPGAWMTNIVNCFTTQASNSVEHYDGHSREYISALVFFLSFFLFSIKNNNEDTTEWLCTPHILNYCYYDDRKMIKLNKMLPRGCLSSTPQLRYVVAYGNGLFVQSLAFEL